MKTHANIYLWFLVVIVSLFHLFTLYTTFSLSFSLFSLNIFMLQQFLASPLPLCISLCNSLFLQKQKQIKKKNGNFSFFRFEAIDDKCVVRCLIIATISIIIVSMLCCHHYYSRVLMFIFVFIVFFYLLLSLLLFLCVIFNTIVPTKRRDTLTCVKQAQFSVAWEDKREKKRTKLY